MHYQRNFAWSNTTLVSLVVTFETTSSVRPCTHHDVDKGTSHRGSRAQVPINRIRGNFGTSLDGLRTYRDLPANHSDLAIPSCRIGEKSLAQLVDQFRHGLTMDYLELRLRDFLCHDHSIITKYLNALADTQYIDEFIELDELLARTYRNF